MCIYELKLNENHYLVMYPQEYSKIISKLNIDLSKLIFVDVYPIAYIDTLIYNIKFLFVNGSQSEPHCFVIETFDEHINVYKYYFVK